MASTRSPLLAHGFLVVRRVNWFDDPPIGTPVPQRTPAIALSNREILKRYRGVEGWPWPEEAHHQINLFSGLAAESEQNNILAYYERVSTYFLCDLIYCKIYSPFDLPSLEDVELLGYDYGFLHSETNCYSIIYNEILYGQEPELRSLAAALNENLLLSSLDSVRNLHGIREEFVATSKADLEIVEPDSLQVIAVFSEPPHV